MAKRRARRRAGSSRREAEKLRSELDKARRDAREVQRANHGLVDRYLDAREGLYSIVRLVMERRVLRRALAGLYREHESITDHGQCTISAHARAALVRTSDGDEGERQ